MLTLVRLAQLSDAIVRRMLLTRSAKPITALVWRAGLSMRLRVQDPAFRDEAAGGRTSARRATARASP